jgi:hypothetical protein
MFTLGKYSKREYIDSILFLLFYMLQKKETQRFFGKKSQILLYKIIYRH